MINAERYEQIIQELIKDNLGDREKVQDLLNELGETIPVYKKSHICGNYIKVGRLTTRNEIILDPPIVESLDNSQPIGVYFAGWYIENKEDFVCLGEHPHNVVEEIYVLGETIGYGTRDEKSIEMVRKVVFYDQYKTGDESAVPIVDGQRYGKMSKIVGIQLPDGSEIKFTYHGI